MCDVIRNFFYKHSFGYHQLQHQIQHISLDCWLLTLSSIYFEIRSSKDCQGLYNVLKNEQDYFLFHYCSSIFQRSLLYEKVSRFGKKCFEQFRPCKRHVEVIGGLFDLAFLMWPGGKWFFFSDCSWMNGRKNEAVVDGAVQRKQETKEKK